MNHGTVTHTLAAARERRTLSELAGILKAQGVTVREALAAARRVERGSVDPKRKLTVYLDPDLLHALKLAAADAGVSQGDLVAAALRAALMGKGGPSQVARDTLNTGAGAALDAALLLRSQEATLEEIAADLNRQGYRTAQGLRWNLSSVCRLLKRPAAGKH